MAAFNIFENDAFSLLSMTNAIQKMPYIPTLLGSMGLFTPVPVNTVTVAVEQVQGKLSIIQTSQRGAPPTTQDAIKRQVRDFRTVRLFKQDTLFSHEIQNVRAFGTESELQTMQTMVAGRQMRLNNDLSLTREYHMLGAINGIVLDADGSSVIYNYFTEFGITQPGEITFSNAAVTAAGGMRAFIQKNIVRPMMRSIGNLPMAEIVVLMGDDFYDWFTNHPDVEKTFINWNASAEMRNGNAFEEFSFAGIRAINYRGTDDNSTVAVPANKARFFLRGVPDLFQVAYSPGESFDVVNTMGLERYSQVVPDRDRNAWVQVEVSSYPLFMCTRPETLLRGTL
jgi:hypothetical protein